MLETMRQSAFAGVIFEKPVSERLAATVGGWPGLAGCGRERRRGGSAVFPAFPRFAAAEGAVSHPVFPVRSGAERGFPPGFSGSQ